MNEVKYLLKEEDAKDFQLIDILKVVWKNKILLFSALIVLLVIVWFTLRGMKDYYQLPLRFYSTVARKEELSSLLQYVSGLAKVKDHKSLSSILAISEGQASTIRNIQTGIEMQNPTVYVFELNLEIYNPELTDTINQAFINYFNRVTYLSEKYRVKQASLEKQLENALKSKSELDSYRAIFSKANENSEGIDVELPDMIFLESVKIQEKIAELEEEKNLLSVANTFIAPVKPIKPIGPKRAIILSGVCILGFVGLTFLFVIKESIQSSN